MEKYSSDSNVSSEDLATELSRLAIDDETFLSPDTESIASSTSEETQAVKATSVVPREKLNEYLLSEGITPIVQPWLEWEQVTDRTKQRYTKRTAEIVSSVLRTISPKDASSLWQAIVTSAAMKKALGLEELSKTSKDYLEALAEAYGNANGWDTRRQILSIMAGIASYKAISVFIPGLSRYHYTIANLHRLQFGRGASMTYQPLVRVRVERQQLDHFLSFITSPHLVQDLPFGQNMLTLSSGKTIEIPNVIRTLIPQRIARQYKQYCDETGFKPFSERTMLRILAECKASVRKSLQGLDYFAAEGARAFEDLESLVHQLSELGLGKESDAFNVQSLKSAKLYLKGDFKVIVFFKTNFKKSVIRRYGWDKISRWGAPNSCRICLSNIDTGVYFL